METNLNFNSAICTSREQSERLLALGLKKETADMYYFWVGGNEYRLKVDDDNNPLKYNMDRTYIPAWSLHRLIEILGVSKMFFNMDFYDSPYEEIIRRIDVFIHTGVFNKEYLE